MTTAPARWRAPFERALPALRIARFGLAVALVAAMGVLAVRDVDFGALTWWLLVPSATAAAAWWTLLARGWAILVSGRTTAHDVATWCRTQVACYVASAVMVQAAVSGLHRPLLVAGAAGVSWAAGLVAVFAPGGLGVREIAYVGLLGSSFGHDDLIAAAIVMRAVTIAAELLVLLAAGRPSTRHAAKNS